MTLLQLRLGVDEMSDELNALDRIHATAVEALRVYDEKGGTNVDFTLAVDQMRIACDAYRIHKQLGKQPDVATAKQDVIGEASDRVTATLWHSRVQYLLDWIDKRGYLAEHRFTYPDGETWYATGHEPNFTEDKPIPVDTPAVAVKKAATSIHTIMMDSELTTRDEVVDKLHDVLLLLNATVREMEYPRAGDTPIEKVRRDYADPDYVGGSTTSPMTLKEEPHHIYVARLERVYKVSQSALRDLKEALGSPNYTNDTLIGHVVPRILSNLETVLDLPTPNTLKFVDVVVTNSPASPAGQLLVDVLRNGNESIRGPWKKGLASRWVLRVKADG